MTNRDEILEALVETYQSRKREGKPVSLGELCADCPDLIDDLRARIKVLEMTGGRANPPTLPPASSHTTAPRSDEHLGSSGIPESIGPYQVIDQIGVGGFGSVFRCRDVKLGREVALKLMPAFGPERADLTRRFLQEAQIMGRLRHPGLPSVHHVAETDQGMLYYTMELVQGETLADLLKNRDELLRDLPRYLDMFKRICQTIGYAHQHGFIHGDLKPASVVVGPSSEVTVTDWGLANLPPDESWGTDVGGVTGTAAYMAPERFAGQKIDELSDVFGLGGILCEILTGAPPHRGSTLLEIIETVFKGRLSETFQRLDQSGAPEELIKLAKSCLAVNKENRPPSAVELALAIDKYNSGRQEQFRREEFERKVKPVKSEAKQNQASFRLSLWWLQQDRYHSAAVLSVIVGALLAALGEMLSIVPLWGGFIIGLVASVFALALGYSRADESVSGT